MLIYAQTPLDISSLNRGGHSRMTNAVGKASAVIVNGWIWNFKKLG